MQPTAVVQFQARLFEEGQLLHNQLTSLPSNDTRIRTAQGLKNGAPSCPSFWIERRVLSDEFYSELAAAALGYNILEEDQCRYDEGNQSLGITYDQYFGKDTSTPRFDEPHVCQKFTTWPNAFTRIR